MEKEALLVLLTKGPLNAGRMQLNHVRFRSSGPQTSPHPPAPFLVQLMLVGAPSLLFLSLDMQFKQTFPWLESQVSEKIFWKTKYIFIN